MVTGGCGFIGVHLVELLANNNLEVISIDHRERAVKTTATIKDVVGDVRDRTLMSEIFSAGDFDCIFDLAAISTIGLRPSEYRNNIEQTHAMTEYCLKYKVFRGQIRQSSPLRAMIGIESDNTTLFGVAEVESNQTSH
jgi:nucleoside-diphosphate-sugar epimerase